MDNKSKTMLILSCVFVTITALLLFYDSYISFSTYALFFGSDPETLGEALGTIFGGIILYAVTILVSIGVIIAAALTLPFDIILLKSNGKKWYSITILVFAIVAIVMAIAFVAMLPIVGQIQDAAKAANSSSSSISSSEALLLL